MFTICAWWNVNSAHIHMSNATTLYCMWLRVDTECQFWDAFILRSSMSCVEFVTFVEIENHSKRAMRSIWNQSFQMLQRNKFDKSLREKKTRIMYIIRGMVWKMLLFTQKKSYVERWVIKSVNALYGSFYFSNKQWCPDVRK